MKSIFLCQRPETVASVYGQETIAALQSAAALDLKVYTWEDVLANPPYFADVECIFSTWGMPALSEEEIRRYFPWLQAVFYGAGSVQRFARAYLHCGVRVFSAWGANAVPVAEYAAAQIVLAAKGYFPLSRIMSSRHDAHHPADLASALREGDAPKAYEIKRNFHGNYGDRVGLVGAGMIGRYVIKLLKNYRLEVLVFDPFLPDARAQELGVVKCPLETLFSTCQVVSNHLANNEQTRNMLTGALFSSMRPYATFINTARGAQVVEDELADVLRQRPDLTALLDVTCVEPAPEGHPFYDLPNCYLTPHIAGSSGDELHRMAEYMLSEYRHWRAGERCEYEVVESMLAIMA